MVLPTSDRLFWAAWIDKNFIGKQPKAKTRGKTIPFLHSIGLFLRGIFGSACIVRQSNYMSKKKF